MTLEQILAKEKANRHEDGVFGMKACKEHILWIVEAFHEDLFTQLKEYVEKANKDLFFNKALVLACWELINEQ